MAHKASGHVKSGHGKLKKITIEHAGNGFMVHQHHEPQDGDNGPRLASMMGHPQSPSVFTKHAPALKHVKGLMSQMHPDTTSGDMTGEDTEQQQS